ncbi:MAG TPA: PDZ domain-containing protein [Burkholderiaceae bacterium]
MSATSTLFPHAHDDDARALLQLARDAAGGAAWDEPVVLRLEGTMEAGDMRGPYVQLVDLARGRSRWQCTLGPASVARGFDGTNAWQLGANGEVIVQDAEAARHEAVTDAWLNARGYWQPGRWPAELALVPSPQADEAGCDVVRALPAGGLPVELWIERASRRLVRIVQQTFGLEVARQLEEQRFVDGRLLPGLIVSGTGDVRREMRLRLGQASVEAGVDAAAFDAPAQALAEPVFLDEARAEALPFDRVDNHVYLDARIGDARLRLMLDTGGMNVLTPAAAARAGLRVVGRLEARGPGERSMDVGLARAERLVIGEALALDDQLFRVLELPDFDEVEGTAFDGIVGVEVFKRLVVDIDYEAAVVRFVRPARFETPPGATTLPLAFHAHVPAVRAEIDGIAGQFWLDTGNRNALTLWSPFVEAHGLAQRLGAGAPTTIGWGVGGPSTGRVGRAGRLLIGELAIEGPVVTMPEARSGPTAAQDVAGNIGGELLRRFAVAFDYTRKLVHLRPNARFGEPFVADRSGLWINRRGQGFVVASVQEGSAAHAAGLRAGDAIVALDDRAAADWTLAQARERLRDPRAGDRVRVRAMREGAAWDAELVLAGV